MSRFTLITDEVFDVENPDPEKITVDGLAHALALVNRYAGHTPEPYSVAQHSFGVATLVPPRLVLPALLHDAHEGLGLGDVISPVKRLLPAWWKTLEHGIDRAIAARFGFDVELLYHPEIKRADLVMLRAEQRYLRGLGPHLGEGSEDLDDEVTRRVEPFEAMPWRSARETFKRALLEAIQWHDRGTTT